MTGLEAGLGQALRTDYFQLREEFTPVGCPEMDPLSAGLITMELNRGDGSLGTFLGVQARLGLGRPGDHRPLAGLAKSPGHHRRVGLRLIQPDFT